MSTTPIGHGKAVAFSYTLRGDDGVVIDASGDGALPYLHGFGNIIPGLEEALVGKLVGDRVQVSIPPEKAYGTFNPAAVQEVPRSQFPPGVDIEIDMMFRAQTGDGTPIDVRVIDTSPTHITLSANHPLAGKTLHFDVTIREVRDATAEELAHGHIHGPGGHHH